MQKVKNKVLKLSLIAILTLGFNGCGSSSSNDEEPEMTNLTVIESDDTYQTENQSPTANAGSDITINEGNSVIFDAINSNDTDGTIVAYEWKEGDIVLSNDISFSKSDLSTGIHPVVLTITDNGGKTVTDTVIITVMENTVADDSTKEIDL